MTAHSYNGNPQFAKDPAQLLLEVVASAFFGRDTFYEPADTTMANACSAMAALINTGRLDLIANSILFARTKLHMRSMPIAMTIQFAKELRAHEVEYPLLRRLMTDVIQRADEVTDALAYSITVFGSKNKVPSAIRRGIGDAMSKFNEYAFAKYDRRRLVTFRDALRILHPKAAHPAASEVFAKIMSGTLEVPYTWEVELSKNGSLPPDLRRPQAEVWGELISSGKLGYMALLRNLRNILEAGVEARRIETICERLADPVQVAKSKQFPFRFATAYDLVSSMRVGGGNAVKAALVKALDHSLGNLPKLGDGVWIIVDCSLSMTSGRTDMGNRAPFQAACLFAAAMAKACSGSFNFALTMFSDYAKEVPLDLSNSVMSISKTLEGAAFGGGTNLGSALQRRASLGFEPDVVVVISDMQVNDLSGHDVSEVFGPETLKVALDISAYPSSPLPPERGWIQLFGWSDNILKWIPTIRAGQSIVETLDVPYLGVDRLKEDPLRIDEAE